MKKTTPARQNAYNLTKPGFECLDAISSGELSMQQLVNLSILVKLAKLGRSMKLNLPEPACSTEEMLRHLASNFDQDDDTSITRSQLDQAYGWLRLVRERLGRLSPATQFNLIEILRKQTDPEHHEAENPQ